MEILAAITGNGMISLGGVVLVCVLCFVAGFVDSIAGGGGLISLPAYLFAGLPVHAAIATNKLSSVMGTTVATLKYLKEGFMRWRLVLPCVPVALLASALGANLVLVSGDGFIRIFMLVVIPIAGFFVLRSKDFGDTPDEGELPGANGRYSAKTTALCLAIAFVVGVYDGFYGPGTGTFLMLLLSGVAHLSIRSSAGLTKAVNLSTNAAAAAVFLASGSMIVGLGLIAGVFNIIGNYLGATLFTNKGARLVRVVILVVLVLFAIRLIAELTGLA